jgi:hypothetical protein
MLLAGIKLSSYKTISRRYENTREKKLDASFLTYVKVKQRLYSIIQAYKKEAIILQVD